MQENSGSHLPCDIFSERAVYYVSNTKPSSEKLQAAAQFENHRPFLKPSKHEPNALPFFPFIFSTTAHEQMSKLFFTKSISSTTSQLAIWIIHVKNKKENNIRAQMFPFLPSMSKMK